MSQELIELRKLAEAATQGEWRYDYDEGYCGELIASNGVSICSFVDEPTASDAAYIAAANPAAVISLLDKLQSLQAEVAEHKENALRNARIAVSIKAERDALAAKLASLQRYEPEIWREDRIRMEPDSQGDWVKFSDIDAAKGGQHEDA
jgi:Ead/Ea22-like protein